MNFSIGRGLMIGALWVAPFACAAQDTSFSDVPQTHPAFSAAEHLKERGILQGYGDGTFRPTQPVIRAETVKIIIAATTKAEIVASASGKTTFPDVPVDAWFAPFIATALTQHLIDGPPATELFRPQATVTLAEALKLIPLGFGVDPKGAYGELTFSLSSDVIDTQAWFFPYLRYAISSSMIKADENGLLSPQRELTRADLAILLHRFLLYREGHRSQTLLSSSSEERSAALNLLKDHALAHAELASARAVVAARGALTMHADDGIVKSAVKLSEATHSLVRGARLHAEGEVSQAVQAASDAWHLSAKAPLFSASSIREAHEIQARASNQADTSRLLLKKETEATASSDPGL